MQEENLKDIIEQVVVLQRAGKQNVTFETEYELERDEAVIMADRGQIARVFVNLLENAAQAIAEREGTNLSHGLVKIVVKKTQTGMLATTVLDNGRGLPQNVEVEKLFDPYVTTRKSGTGLGLAIVRRVVDEHEGQIRISRRKEGGAAVEVLFPVHVA